MLTNRDFGPGCDAAVAGLETLKTLNSCHHESAGLHHDATAPRWAKGLRGAPKDVKFFFI